MNKKPIGPTLHGTLDYGFLAVIALAPKLFNLKGNARTICYGFAAMIGLTNSLSQHGVALKRLIPMSVHGKLEMGLVPSLLLIPAATGALKERNALRFFSLYFIGALTTFLLTDFEVSEP